MTEYKLAKNIERYDSAPALRSARWVYLLRMQITNDKANLIPNQFFQQQNNLEDAFKMARLANEKETADAKGLDLATFRAWVSSGRLPGPIADCGKYDLKAIDAAIDRVSGLGSPANALDAWRLKATRHASAS